LIKPLKGVEIVHRPEQNTLWDFPKVVNQYSQQLSTEQVSLKFDLKLNPDIYTKSYYKKPPQFAIWLQEVPKGTIHTVWVTSKTGIGDWGKNVVRTVSLPLWVSRWNLVTKSRSYPTPENPVINSVTGATPKLDFTVETIVPAKKLWNYFIEVNVSGDYNDAFPVTQKDGKRDRQGNGQPSIIYRGVITSSLGIQSSPKLIGRTDQLQNVRYIINDLEGITTAKDLFSKIEVSCEPSK
jgi:hypothetical protein